MNLIEFKIYSMNYFSFSLTTKTTGCNSNLVMVKDFAFNVTRRVFAKRKVHFMLLVLLLLTLVQAAVPYASFDAFGNIMSSILQPSFSFNKTYPMWNSNILNF